MTTLDEFAREVQRHYPRIYIACHVDHDARRGQGAKVSARDQTILAHIPNKGVRPNALAGHLRITASTLSAALTRLARMGLIDLAPMPSDRRGKVVQLTGLGKAALSRTSVLDIARVRAALSRLSAVECAVAVRGLELLADAAQAAPGEDSQ